MVWLRIVGALVLLILATYLVRWLVPRRGAPVNRHQFVRWDLAPIVGFFGTLLLALSFALAVQNDAVAPWGWGFAFGFVVSALGWMLGIYRPNGHRRKRAGVGLGVKRLVPPALVLLIGLYLAVRVLGAALEVFAAAAFGVGVLALAVTLFVGSKPEITEGK
jgi:hypothetical protein